MNIDEKIKELEEKQEEISKAIEVLEKEKENTFKRWRAKLGFRYFYLCDDGVILYATDFYNMSDDYRYATGNYFETEAEALRYKQNRLTYQQLKDIALKLNKGRNFDWNDENQSKYFICFNYAQGEFKLDYNVILKNPTAIYCLDSSFYRVALEEIGEDKLKQLLEWGI